MTTSTEFEKISIALAKSSDQERSEIYKHIRKLAVEHPEKFRSLLSEFPLNEDSALFEIFEALGENCIEFTTLIISEINRLLEASKNPDTRVYPFIALGGFHKVNDPQVRREIESNVLGYTESNFINTRRTVINLIIDQKYENSILLREKMEKLSNDSDWKVRVLARKYLNKKQSLVDQVKTKFSDPMFW